MLIAASIAKKRSTNTQASIFVFERKSLDVAAGGGFGAKASATSVRKAQDEVVERLKKEASSLARLRHPSILQLVEPVEETRNGGLMFVTEAVLASLSAALLQKDRDGSMGRQNYSTATTTNAVGIDELEIQKGLLQVAKGLEFLHDSAKLVHGNLTPDAIFINAKSDWKISGLAFAGPPDNAEGHQSVPQISLSEALYSDPRLPPTVQLNLDYSSPDFVLDSNINFSADVFSLGLILVACYREPHRSPIEAHGNQATYKKIMSSSSSAPARQNNFGCANKLPQALDSTLSRILARRPAGRVSAAEFQQSEYFDNILVNTMRFLDGLPAKTADEKKQFMRGLPKVMAQFPVSVLEKKVLSVLLDELKDKDLLALILQNVFEIVRMVPSRRDMLATKILPVLKETFTAPSKSADRDTSKEAGLVVFLDHIQIISENSSAQQFKEDVLPIVSAAMQSTTHSLVDAGLGTLPLILPVLDFSTVKHDLFPVIATVFAKTSSLGIKVRGLEALAILCGASDNVTVGSKDDLSGISNPQETARSNISSLDKFTMQEKVVPLLKGIKTKEPTVMMTSLKVFQQVAKVADIEYLASEVMPILWNFALGPLLNLSEFKAYMDVINAVTLKIQREQIKKLRELGSTDRSGDPDHEKRLASSANLQQNGTQGGSGVEGDFEKLVLGGRAKASNDPFAGALEDGQKLVPNPASYSWQSGSGTITPTPRANLLQPRQAQSRSITPDVSVAGFPSLQPNTSAWSQSTSMVDRTTQNSSSARNTEQTGMYTNPVSSPTGMSAWNQQPTPSISPGASRLQASSYMSAVPALATTSNNAFTNGRTNNAFAPILSPPPASSPWQTSTAPTQQGFQSNRNTTHGITQGNQQQQQNTPKPPPGGLDKYQSLL